MQNQIYRGVVLNKIPSSDKEKSNNLNFMYRGILYIKLAVNKIPNKDICMFYRGNFYNKFFG
jgi:hypothetical protein